MGRIEIIEPEGVTNYLTNPSSEDQSAGLTSIVAVGSTVTRSLEYARFGRASAKVVTDSLAQHEGVRYDASPSLASTPVAASVYARGEGKIRLRMVDNDNSLQWIGDPVILDYERWKRLFVIGHLGANLVTDLDIFAETFDYCPSVTFYLDGWQLEPNGYVTSYVDGDLEREVAPHDGMPFFRWEGPRHESRSVRTDNYRLGGRPRDLTQGLDFKLWPTQISGFGMPRIGLITQRLGSLDGVRVQRTRAMARTIMMTFWASRNNRALVTQPARLTRLHKAREALEAVVKPDAVQMFQPLLLRYIDGAGPLEIPAYYEMGMEFDGDLRNPYQNSFSVRLIAPDPYWKADSQDVLELTESQNVANAQRILIRLNGEWQVMGTVDAVVREVRVAPNGDVYFGGDFTNVDGDADCSRICRWNPEEGPQPLDEGIDDGSVLEIKFHPDGTVYVGGDFDDIGGVAHNNCAIYDPSSDSWSTMGGGAPPGLDDNVQGIAIDEDGIVFMGGVFTATADAVTTLNHVASYNPTTNTFSALGGGPGVDTTVHAVEVDIDGSTIYFGGNFTQETGGAANSLLRLASWDGTSFEQLSDGADDRVRRFARGADGRLYFGGEFTSAGRVDAEKIGVYNRQEIYALGQEGDGLVGGTVCRGLAVSAKGLLLAGGDFTSATGAALARQAATWNRTRFAHLDIDLPGTPTVYAVGYRGDDPILAGDFNGTAVVSEIQTATNKGNAAAGPILDVLGPCRLEWLENQSAAALIRLDLEVGAGEEVLVDLRPGLHKAISTVKGNVIEGVLPDSDVGEFKMLPGDNVLAFFAEDTTSDTEITLRWRVPHWSFDAYS